MPYVWPTAPAAEEGSIATTTLVELGAGVHAVTDSAQRAARLVIPQYVESTFPFDSEAAAGQKPGGGRAVDSFIAAASLSRAPLFKRNAADFTTVASLVEIVSV